MEVSKIHYSFKPSQVRPLTAFDGFSTEDMARVGITADTEHIGVKMAMDAATPGATPVQFLQYWMPKAIETLTQARTADRLLGRDILGSWEDEEVIVKTIRHTGHVGLYTDTSDVPLAGYDFELDKRGTVRFELGVQTAQLADIRAGRMQINPDGERRAALATAFAINQNKVAFNGYGGTDTPVYGLLNDPNLGGYVAETDVKPFKDSTFKEICDRINMWITLLGKQTGNNFDAQVDSFRLALSPAAYNAMITTLNAMGTLSVMDFVKKTFPKIDVVAVNEFIGVNADQDVAYLIVDSLGGNSVAIQAITAEMRLLGVEPRLKGTLEAYTSGTAGVIVTQPVGIVRATNV